MQKSKRCLAAAVAAMASTLLVSSAARADTPTIIFDLRVHGTDAKDATVYRASDAVQIDLYATVLGFDADPLNDRVSLGAGYFKSSAGGLLGNLTGIAPPSPFNQSGSSAGVQHDVDSDGDLDLGNPSTPQFDFYAYRAFPPEDTQPAEGAFIGRVRFNPQTLTSDSTQISFLARSTTLLLWLDGQGVIGGTPYTDTSQVNIVYGAPVTIHGAPDVDPGPVTYLSGSVAAHTTISTHISASPGTTLTYSTGVDAVTGGTLDAPGGTVLVRVNDVTSGNAGGTMYLNGISIGTTADGTFTQSAGFTRSSVTVGAADDLHGTLNITGGTYEGGVTVGLAGSTATGYFHQTGGSSNLTGMVVNAGSTAQVGGGSLVASTLSINDGGTFVQSGGQSEATGTLLVGAGSGHGTLNVQAGALTASKTVVGGTAGASGEVHQTGGTFLAGALTIGSNDPAHPSTYQISNGQLRPSNLGLLANGFISQSGGEVSAVGPLLAINGTGADQSQYVLSGGTIGGFGLLISKTNATAVAASGRRAGLVQTGGAVNVSEVSVDSAGNYDALGGSINASRSVSIAGTIDFGGGSASLNLGNNCFGDFARGQILNATHATFTGGTGSIMEFGAGFDPLTQIGTLQTQGIVHIAGQPLVIPASKSVGGSGTITGDVTNHGAVAPGNSPGVLNVSGNYTQASDASLVMEIAGTSSDKFDQLSITGSASLDGELDISLLDGFVPASGDQFHILSAASLTGIFGNAPGGIDVVGAAGHFDVVYSPTGVTLTNFQAVPEPAAGVSMLLALGGAALRRWRRR
jgi:hypothetical protein